MVLSFDPGQLVLRYCFLAGYFPVCGLVNIMGYSILALLSKDFVRLIIVAFIIATPLAWYGMSRWLEEYAYRVELQWWTFLTTGIGALSIAVFVVSFKSLNTASINPVKSLRAD
jgi:putative ABC transport system permease protein